MNPQARIGLDNPAFAGRLRQVQPRPRTADVNRLRHHPTPRAPFVVSTLTPTSTPSQVSATQTVTMKVQSVQGLTASDASRIQPRRVTQTPVVLAAAKPHVITPALAVAPQASSMQVAPVRSAQVPIYKPQPFAVPAKPKQQQSHVLKRQSFQLASKPASTFASQLEIAEPKPKRSKLQMALVGMAVFVFGVGIFASIQTVLTNHNATAQVSALSKKANDQPATSDAAGGTVAAPSTVKPPAATVASYTVGPAYPKYLNIPELGVHARILSLGILSSGALATPNNVFDTGWYNESSLPGQPGAMLIDGHVSSWTSHGVFYGIKNLKPGDTMQVQRGDGTMFTYKVVRTQTFSASGVDMQSAVTPVTAGKPGLNLITCTGSVKPGTSEFNERVIVYTEQV